MRLICLEMGRGNILSPTFFCFVPLFIYPSSSLPITFIFLSPSVKQASGSSDSSGSSSTESTPSPGGRISTVLPSDELRCWGSTSSFCMDEEEDESIKLGSSSWNYRGSVVIGANLLSWLFSIYMYSSATGVYLSVETRHCSSSHSWALTLQSSSFYFIITCSIDQMYLQALVLSFIWWFKSVYVTTHNKRRFVLRECTVGTFDMTSVRGRVHAVFQCIINPSLK